MASRKPRLDTMNDRLWWAYHAVPRDEHGKLPKPVDLDVAANVPRGTLTKFFRGELRSLGEKRIHALSEAMGVSPFWVQYGEGPAPECHYPVPRRPRRFDDRLSRRSSSTIAGDDIVEALALEGLERGPSTQRVYALLEEQTLNAFQIYSALLEEFRSQTGSDEKAEAVKPRQVQGRSRVRTKATSPKRASGKA